MHVRAFIMQDLGIENPGKRTHTLHTHKTSCQWL